MESTKDSQYEMPLTDWASCPPGELQRLVGRLNVIEHCANRKRFCFCWAGALLLAVGLLVGAGTLWTAKMSGHAGLTCQQCQSHFIAYHEHLTDSSDNLSTGNLSTGNLSTGNLKAEKTEIMNSVLAEKMKTHLAGCGPCRAKFVTLHSNPEK